MPLPSFTTVCLRNRKIARGIYEFVLQKPENFSFTAGQYVMFDVPLIENPSDIQVRAFSIASGPDEDELLFVAKMKEGGRASRWIEEKLREGTEVRMQGPLGIFTIKDGTRDILLIGTGTGVAPFRGHIRDLLSRKDIRKIDLVFGVRNEEDLFWIDEFQSLAIADRPLHVHLALTQPSEEWKGHRGRVQTLAPLIAPDIATRDVYICGSPAMTTELKKSCLEEWNVPKAQLHVEGYV